MLNPIQIWVDRPGRRFNLPMPSLSMAIWLAAAMGAVLVLFVCATAPVLATDALHGAGHPGHVAHEAWPAGPRT